MLYVSFAVSCALLLSAIWFYRKGKQSAEMEVLEDENEILKEQIDMSPDPVISNVIKRMREKD